MGCIPIDELHVGRAAPQRERGIEQLDRLVGLGVAGLDPLGHHPVESVAVEIVVRHVEAVAALAVDECVGWEDAPKSGRVGLHRTGRVVGERITPQQFGDGVGRERAVDVQEEGGDEASLQIAAQRDGDAIAARHGEWSEHAITGLAVPSHAGRVYETGGDGAGCRTCVESIRPSRRPNVPRANAG